jgi:hypothetical protein
MGVAGRKFTELYNVQHLQSAQLDRVSRVCISTIQRLYSMLRSCSFGLETRTPQGAVHTRRQAALSVGSTKLSRPQSLNERRRN